MEAPRFTIGQPVEANSVAVAYGGWISDWERTPLWVHGVSISRNGYVYSVVEQWPPRFEHRADGDGVTTDFMESDLSPRSIVGFGSTPEDAASGTGRGEK